jgi:hypothetical protein
MALDTYAALKTSVLSWLARPGDPLVEPSVPDMVRLFEAEASRRLRVGASEIAAVLTATAGYPWIALPTAFAQLRSVSIGGGGGTSKLQFLPNSDGHWHSLLYRRGLPEYFTLFGGTNLQLGPMPDSAYSISILYQGGVPPLSDANPSNWLLAAAPDCYLFGALVEAEAFIGHDERIAIWLGRRDAAFAGIEMADRKARWPGGPLQITVDGLTGPGGPGGMASGGATTIPEPEPEPLEPGAVRVVNPASGGVVTMLAGERALYVEGGPRASLSLTLPPDPTDSMLVDISFENPVTALTVTDLAEPTSAYGPGAGLQFRYVDDEWRYWK